VNRLRNKYDTIKAFKKIYMISIQESITLGAEITQKMLHFMMKCIDLYIFDRQACDAVLLKINKKIILVLKCIVYIY